MTAVELGKKIRETQKQLIMLTGGFELGGKRL